MKTVEEFINCEQYWRVIPNYDTIDAMIEFAKMHVKQALKNASEKAIVEWSANGDEIVINQNSILNAYPFENIK